MSNVFQFLFYHYQCFATRCYPQIPENAENILFEQILNTCENLNQTGDVESTLRFESEWRNLPFPFHFTMSGSAPIRASAFYLGRETDATSPSSVSSVRPSVSLGATAAAVLRLRIRRRRKYASGDGTEQPGVTPIIKVVIHSSIV